MQTELKKMIEGASRACDDIFRDSGEILPMWDAETADNRRILIPVLSGDKDITAALIRAKFELEQVVRYVFITEAWVLMAKPGTPMATHALGGGSLEHVPGRTEEVMFMGEDENGIVMAHRDIIRGKGKPKLGPLRWVPADSGGFEGRLVGMLPRGRKTEH